MLTPANALILRLKRNNKAECYCLSMNCFPSVKSDGGEGLLFGIDWIAF